MQVDVFDLFEGLEATLLALGGHVTEDECLDRFVVAKDGQGAWYVVFKCPAFDDVHVGDYDGHNTGLERFAVYKHLFDVLTANVNVFYFFWNYVFSLGEFEDVLLSVDDFETAGLKTKDVS